METLQRKAKESGEVMMMTMLREQLPPPEPVTERTTYAAYVKSVLLGLSVKDFRRARKGVNKVLRPFCESDSTDDDSEDRSNRPPSIQPSTQSWVTVIDDFSQGQAVTTEPHKHTLLTPKISNRSPQAAYGPKCSTNTSEHRSDGSSILDWPVPSAITVSLNNDRLVGTDRRPFTLDNV
ncbi:hypothetical protein NHX12_022666 [Muraenolepis orangiensis]|uniref:Uncharacterized protein n=1 Tax=Muraenolepis orangiensis TaxID=630683 RepID=A0A9Q0ENN4_9TELE|nr:hypothetical protein NHX12_022666 [Muraenolepis orangiensis]